MLIRKMFVSTAFVVQMHLLMLSPLISSTDLVCQSGPGSWPSSVYAESAVYPMANSAAQVSFTLYPRLSCLEFSWEVKLLLLLLKIVILSSSPWPVTVAFSTEAMHSAVNHIFVICRMFFLSFLEIQIIGYSLKIMATFLAWILSFSLVVIFTIPLMTQWTDYCTLYTCYFGTDLNICLQIVWLHVIWLHDTLPY